MPGPCTISSKLSNGSAHSKRPSPASALLGWQYLSGQRGASIQLAPRAIAHPLQAQSVRDLLRRHCCAISPASRSAARTSGQVLLVREDEQQAVLHLAVLQDPMQLLLRLVDPLLVLAVDDEDEALRAGVVVPPQWPDLVLSSDVPARSASTRRASERTCPGQ